MKLSVLATTGALCAMLTTSVVAQDTFSGVYYDLKAKSFTPVAGVKMEEAKNVFGIPGFDLSLSAMKSLDSIREGIGFAVSYYWEGLSDRWGLTVGLGFSLAGNALKINSIGPVVGLTYKF